MAITNEVIQDILAKADIVDVIKNYITVYQKGNGYTAVCPFHDDKHPSLTITPSKQIFKCFACGKGGNAFTFVQEYEKITFIDAVRKVANMINYTSPSLEIVRAERNVDSSTKKVLKALDDASKLYHYVLQTKSGEKGLNYFHERDISNEMIDYFSLGMSPENGQATIKALRSKNNDVSSLENSGLLIRVGQDFADRFQGRVMFPIYNEYDEIIGFSGRIIEKTGEAKYVNSPGTVVFNKSSVLYNYQNAKKEAKRAGYCYVVEGFMDVFALYKAGIRSSVAIMGTAFTELHAKMLKKLNVELRLCLDGDDPGQHGILAMSNILDDADISYKIVNYQDDLRDPDEILIQDGKEALIKRLNTLCEKNEFLINYYKTKFDLNSVDGKKGFVSEVAHNTYGIDDPLKREAIIRKVASLVNVSYEAVRNSFNFAVRDIKEKKVVSTEEEFFSTKKKVYSNKSRAQRFIIGQMITQSNAYEYVKGLKQVVFTDEIYVLLANYIADLYDDKANISVNGLIGSIQASGGNQKLIDEVISISEDKQQVPEFSPDSINDCLKVIQAEVQREQQKKALENEAWEYDDIERAKMLDKRISK